MRIIDYQYIWKAKFFSTKDPLVHEFAGIRQRISNKPRPSTAHSRKIGVLYFTDIVTGLKHFSCWFVSYAKDLSDIVIENQDIVLPPAMQSISEDISYQFYSAVLTHIPDKTPVLSMHGNHFRYFYYPDHSPLMDLQIIPFDL